MICDEAKTLIESDFLAKGNGNYSLPLQNHLLGCRRCRTHGAKLARVMQTVQLEKIIPPSDRILLQLLSESRAKAAKNGAKKKRLFKFAVGTAAAALLFFAANFAYDYYQNRPDAKSAKAQEADLGLTPLFSDLKVSEDKSAPALTMSAKNPSASKETDDRFAKISQNLSKDLKAEINTSNGIKKSKTATTPKRTPTKTSTATNPKTQNVPPSESAAVVANETESETVTTASTPVTKVTTKKTTAKTQAKSVKVVTAKKTTITAKKQTAQKSTDDSESAVDPEFLQALNNLTLPANENVQDTNAEPLPIFPEKMTDLESLTTKASEATIKGEDGSEVEFTETDCAAAGEAENFEAEFSNQLLVTALTELAKDNPRVLEKSGLPPEMQMSLLSGSAAPLVNAVAASHSANSGATMIAPDDIYKLLGGPARAPSSRSGTRGSYARGAQLYGLLATPAEGTVRNEALANGQHAAFTGLHGKLSDGTVLGNEPSAANEAVQESLPPEILEEAYHYDYCPLEQAAML